MEPRHQAAAGLGSCPVEILYLILRFLSPPELHALSLVNKDFRQIAEPFLYSRIRWNWREARPPPITQFIRTMLSRPELAAYITDAYLDGQISWEEFRFKFPKIPISSAELDAASVFIRGSGVPYSDLWIEELRQGRTDAFVALLLAQLPNLKCLYLANIFTRQSTLIGMLFQSATCGSTDYRLPDFRHLRDVFFLHPTSEDELRGKKIKNTEDTLPLFYLPNVQRISASIENPVQLTWPAAQLPVPSKLTSLALTTIREAYLGKLLAVTRDVETLHWHWSYQFVMGDEFITPTIDLDGIGAAISHVRGTLSDLTITAVASSDSCSIYIPGVETTGSLHAMVNFDKLKRLQIPWSFLVGFTQKTTKRWQDLMPRNIEVLVITDDLRDENEDGIEPEYPEWEWDHPSMLGVLQSWMKNWKAYTPHLRRISLVLTMIYGWRDECCPWLRQQLIELGAQVGVQFDVIDLTEYQAITDSKGNHREVFLHDPITQTLTTGQLADYG
ncbi:hypothetical protein BDV26DRAFT_293462 [Aspergillus bertholletiae]|uniref:F-box domain-containing protein n=1 Tax=Aspergillus bertholletiae TaxID=1226010 RepID=A0A5N7B4X9_9EURO|nr:hypothetical protein BDV26DRAFT_293462 [Aspergillus bertholletiae]